MSSSNPTGTGRNPRDDRNVGAYRLGEPAPKRRAAWLLPLLVLLALALLALLLWLFLRDRGDGAKTPAAAATATVSADATVSAEATATPSAAVTTAEPTPATTTAAGTAAGAGADAGAAGTLLAGGQTVLPPAGGPLGNLARYAGKPVTANGVQVQSVPSDEGFWVGSSATDRVWVQLTGTAGESAYQVKAGDKIDFSGGKVVPTPAGFAQKVGVTAAEGAAQLTSQRQHVSLAQSAVHLSS